MRGPRRIHDLRTVKNVAYAWRQMLVYLSLASRNVDGFLTKARAFIAAQKAPFCAKFEPIFAGLEDAHAGRAPRVKLLGWTDGPHPLVD